MQDTLDVTGAVTNTILYLYSERGTTQVYNSGVTDGATKVQTSPLTS